jgi:formate hydrogenlyase transcriptional activator
MVRNEHGHRCLKQAEAKLREDERALRRITDAIPQNIVILDLDGSPIYANKATLDYTGLTMADVVGSDFRARIFHREDLERVRDQRQAARIPSLSQGRGD